MSNEGAWTLSLVGLASALVGAFIGFGFGMPALGLNQHGRNSIETTAVAEGIAAVLYFFGAILQIQGGRALAQPRRPTREGLLLGLVSQILGLAALVVPSARRGDWEPIAIALILLVFVMGPLWAGLLSVWLGTHSPDSG